METSRQMPVMVKVTLCILKPDSSCQKMKDDRR